MTRNRRKIAKASRNAFHAMLKAHDKTTYSITHATVKSFTETLKVGDRVCRCDRTIEGYDGYDFTTVTSITESIIYTDSGVNFWKNTGLSTTKNYVLLPVEHVNTVLSFRK